MIYIMCISSPHYPPLSFPLHRVQKTNADKAAFGRSRVRGDVKAVCIVFSKDALNKVKRLRKGKKGEREAGVRGELS